MEAVLADWQTAPIDEKLRATFAFLSKLTLAPVEVGPGDVAELRAAGVGDEAIEDAIEVCALFNVIDRIADALAFQSNALVFSPEQLRQNAAETLAKGYA